MKRNIVLGVYIIAGVLYLNYRNISASNVFPFQNISLSLEERVTDLVNRLTLDELVGSMARGGSEAGPNIAIPRLGIPPYQFNTECLHGAVRPNPGTGFPQSIGLGATFSPDLIEMMATVIGTEVRAFHHEAVRKGDYGMQKGLTCFSPMLNIVRHPLWGRVQESYGEDPFLIGSFAEAFVQGLQGDHPRYIRAGTCCKHFAVHSGPENLPTSRFSFNSVVNERDLQLTYLPHFRRCIGAGSISVMCSYNSINGIPACCNKRFLTDFARSECGLKGFIIGDDGAVEHIETQHHYAKTKLEAAVLAVKAGVNLELPMAADGALFQLYPAVRDGNISMDLLRERVKDLFHVRMRLGNFDPPELNPYSSIPLSVVQSEGHRKLAHIATVKSFVLLKNDYNTLPFKQGSIKNLAIIGPAADDMGLLYGTYSPEIDPRYATTPYAGLKSAAPNVVLEVGCVGGTGCSSYNESHVQQVVEGADQVIVCVGMGSQFEEEDTDRPTLQLPGLQNKLLADIMAYAKKPIVVIVFSGGPVDLSILKQSKNVGAVIMGFYSAQATGEALREILFTRIEGSENFVAKEVVTSPAGRSPYTWPKSLDQIPPMVNYSMEGRTYRYWRGPGAPLYPFGYGLSYSRFNYSDLTINPNIITTSDQNVTVTVKVLNLGPYDSDEVMQVYISWVQSSVQMPDIQLVGVVRRMIRYPAPPQSISVNIKASQLSVWDEQKGFFLNNGLASALRNLPPKSTSVTFFADFLGETCLSPGVINVYVGGQQPFQETDVGSNVLHDVIKISVS